MPDMTKKGAHVNSVLEWMEYEAQELREKAKDCESKASTLDQARRKLERAIDEESAKVDGA